MVAGNRGNTALVVLLAIALVGAGAWLLRDHIPGLGGGEPVEVSPEAAASAQAKLDRLRDDGDTVRLNDVEVTSYLRYRLDGPMGGLLHEPEVRIADGRLRVTGRFPTEQLPEAPELNRARGFLPDTADVDVSGRVRTLADGRGALLLESASFARIPIPREMYGRVFERLGRAEEPGVAREEFPFALPPGVGGVTVQGDHLVLTPAG
jgi:hypothetical protein